MERRKRSKELFVPCFMMLLIVFMKNMAPAVNPPVSFPVSQLQDFPVDKGKTLFVVSNNIASVDAVMRHVAANLSTTYQLFETEDSALKAYFMKRSEVSAGIIFGYQSKGNIFSYAIRMPGDQIASTQDRFMMNTGFCRHRNPNGTSTAGGCQANTYLQTGFAYLQYVIDQALLQALTNMAVMYLLLRVLELRSMRGSFFDALRFCCANSIDVVNATNTDIIQDEDEDVKQERQRVDNIECRTDGGQNVVAFVNQIRKEYTKAKTYQSKGKVKVAVRNLSFAVNKGEVLGLLGPNGAGKTTALGIMAAEVTPTRGKVVVAGQLVQTSLSPSSVPLGLCPQQDPLWEPLTLKEHLELYAAIKGVPEAEVSRVIKYFVDNLKLQEHQNKTTKELSGGTKRKLSYAISMLGNPKVVLLDEPSTGLDPRSKRFLWDIISSNIVGQDRGAILTTHYMEEADALCTRVAIMVNGKTKCLGPTQYLKSKYGSGYLLEIKLSGSSTATCEELEARVKKLERHLVTLFPGATCLESFAERARYEIPQTDVEVLSSTFAALEETKRTHGVEEYSFSQSTLEQVFLNLAKKQIEEG